MSREASSQRALLYFTHRHDEEKEKKMGNLVLFLPPNADQAVRRPSAGRAIGVLLAAPGDDDHNKLET